MYLDEFYNYKNQLMDDILTDINIVSLINDNVNLENSNSLMYTQVFPFEYIPDTVEKGKTFVCCDVDIDKSFNKTYLLPTLYVWVFTHRSNLVLPNGEGVRTDKLCTKICQKINGSKMYGLGELNLHAVKRFAPMTDFQGKCMIFHATDFNRKHNPNAQIPINRRDK